MRAGLITLGVSIGLVALFGMVEWAVALIPAWFGYIAVLGLLAVFAFAIAKLVQNAIR